jgi:molybdopterin synthase sulfur carrier subunit
MTKHDYIIKTMQVKVLFFGVLTDVTGTVVRHYNEVASTDELIFMIETDFPAIAHYTYRIARNNEFITGNVLLSNGDEIAIMPPFAGG